MSSPNLLPADTHLHSVHCGHADGTPLDYARAAFSLGIPEVAMTDHIPVPDDYDPHSRMPLTAFPDYLEAVGEAVAAFPGRVRLGIEADFYPGCQSYLPAFLAAHTFDLVLGSVHFIGDWGFDNPVNLVRWRDADVREVWVEYLGLVRLLAQSRLFDVVTHFDLPKKFGHRLPENELLALANSVLDDLAESGMALEINTGGLRKPVAEIYPAPELLRRARARDIPIVFGSDAHQPDEAGHAFQQAVKLAREAGYTHYARFRERRYSLIPLPA